MKVNTSRFQKRIQDNAKEASRPGTGEIHSVSALILEVYEEEFLDLYPDAQVAGLVERYPGLLFSKVKIDSGEIFVLPFRETESQVHLVYGNNALLANRKCRVEFSGTNIYNGSIVLDRDYKTKQVNLATACRAFDIGNII